jgi:hypothetical protein
VLFVQKFKNIFYVVLMCFLKKKQKIKKKYEYGQTPPIIPHKLGLPCTSLQLDKYDPELSTLLASDVNKAIATAGRYSYIFAQPSLAMHLLSNLFIMYDDAVSEKSL